MVRISKIYRIIISALLALLGFSCGNGGVGPTPVEYGSPNATYKAKGVVVSETDDSPIEGIRAVLTESKEDDYPMDAAYTDSEGSFFLNSRQSSGYYKLYVELIDVDGEENGLFDGMEIEADYTDKQFTGGDGRWYHGEAEIDLGTIKMKPNSKDENNKDET